MTSALLRVLVAHNRYQQRGGEDAVVEEEVALLRRHGQEVRLYERDNHDLAAMPTTSAALQTLWSCRTMAEAGALMDDFRPDVLHVHNTFPLISPSVYWAASRRGVPVVQTLHNFRLVCPQGLMLRDGKPCEDCVGRTPWPGVVHACYRGSRAQTGALAAMLTSHRLAGSWSRRVTRYIALNSFCRDRFIAGGLPAERICVKPNSVDLPDAPQAGRTGFLFVGRLSQEKGISVLAQAAQQAAPAVAVRIAGTGPEEALVTQHPHLRMLGALAPEAVYAEMRSAMALLLPSIWYENFPRTLVEAFACGLPVIASRLGSMAALVDDGQTGLLFEPGDAADLAAKLRWAEAHPERLLQMGRTARAQYEREWTGDACYRRLIEIYGQARAAVGTAATASVP